MSIKISRETAPYIRRQFNITHMMLDVIIALVPVILFSIYKFGINAIFIYLISIITTYVTEFIFYKMSNEEYNLPKKVAGLLTALIYSLIIPVNTDYYTVFIGILFAVFIGKLVFGGIGNNIANPAALGRVFVTVTFNTTLGYMSADMISGATALTIFKDTGIFSGDTQYTIKNLFLGNVPGSMGEVSSIAIIMGFVYLIIKKTSDYRITASFIATFVFLSIVAAFSSGYDLMYFTLFQLFSGGLLFGAVFMITDPVTAPITSTGRIIFAVYAAALTLFIRLYSSYPEGVAFSILIMNMFAPSIDYYKWSTNKYSKNFFIFIASSLLVFSLIIILAGGVS